MNHSGAIDLGLAERIREARERSPCDSWVARWEWTHVPKERKKTSPSPAFCTRPIMPRMAAIPANEVATIPHTVGIRDAGTFRRRIMKLMQKPIEVGGPRRLSRMLAYATFGLATSFGALSLRANASDTPAQASALTRAFIHISCRPVAEYPGTTPGHLVPRRPLFYPEEARNAGIEGTAVLRATITKSGTLEDPESPFGPKGSPTSDSASGAPVAVRALFSERQTHRGQGGNHGRLQPRVKHIIAQIVDE